MISLNKNESLSWNSLSSQIKKSLILILIAVLLLGGFSGGFIYYLWPHKEEVNYLNKRISSLQEAQMKLNYIEAKYPEWRKMLEDADQAYNRLERENRELREQLKVSKKSQSDGVQEEELAPGYNRCLEHAYNDFDMKDCSQAAFEYWDRKLNIVYKKAINIYNRSTNPKDCVATLKKMETGWVVFHDIMSGYIYEGGILGGGGTMHRMLGINFLAHETKRQCERLQSIIDYEE